MTPDSTIHPHDDLAVYALDALEPHERAQVEAHLAVCQACRDELDGYRATLGHMAVPETPPARVWEGIARQVRGGTPGVVPASRPAPSPDGSAAHDPAVVHLAERRRPWYQRGTSLAAAAVALVVLAVGALVVGLGGDGEDSVVEAAEKAADDPDSTVVELAAAGSPTARVVATPGAVDYVVFDDLPALPAERTYQLWRTDEGAPVSLGVLGDGADRAARVTLPESTTAFAISEEPAGGSASPTEIVAS